MYGKVVALLDDRACVVDAREIEAGVVLRVSRFNARVMRSTSPVVAVAEQRASICSAPAIRPAPPWRSLAAAVVGMHAENDPITCGDMTLELSAGRRTRWAGTTRPLW